jgi:hypothetical protein
MSKDDEQYDPVSLSVLKGLQRGTGRDAGHRQMSWEEARAFYEQLPEPERSHLVEQWERDKLQSDSEEG